MRETKETEMNATILEMRREPETWTEQYQRLTAAGHHALEAIRMTAPARLLAREARNLTLTAPMAPRKAA
jgi:hypothetical protein